MLTKMLTNDEKFKEKLRIMKLPLAEKEIINAKPESTKCHKCGKEIFPKLACYGLLKSQWVISDICYDCYSKQQEEFNKSQIIGEIKHKIYSKIPQEYIPVKLENCSKEVKDYFAGRYFEKWLYLHGTCGTGKTYSLYALWKNFIKNRIPAEIINSVDLLDEIKIRFKGNNREDSDIEFIEKLCNCPILLLDDLGAEKATDWVQERMYKIINTRYENGKRMIIASNKNINGLKESLGDRIASRIAGKSIIVELSGEDRRLALDNQRKIDDFDKQL